MMTKYLEQNTFPMQSKNKHESVELLVAILGFEAADEAKLSRIFKIVRLNERNYKAFTFSSTVSSDILLVNYDNPKALEKKDMILRAHPQTQVVAVSRGSLIEPPAYHIRGMLIAARVLSVIDKVLVEPRTQKDLELPLGIVISTFEQTLEIPEKKQAQTTNTDSVKSNSQAIRQDGYCVLVVDDSPAIQKSLELNLSKLPEVGLIDFAISGESAIEKAESKKYDLIFLDVMMPGIDGYETCTRLRKIMGYKKTPIVMVSGKTSPLDEVKGVMSGCTTYLTKPVQSDAFQKLSIRMLAWLESKK